jgi:glycosidase
MKRYIILLLLISSTLSAFAQFVSLSPSSAGADDSAVLTFDASEGNGELMGADKVYLHHGVVISGPSGLEWTNVIGNWGADDGVGEMEPVAGQPDKWQISFEPSIREYFDVAANEDIFRISAVFRSADGNVKASLPPGNYGWGISAENGDIYIDLDAGNFITLDAPLEENILLNPGESFEIRASASSEVSSLKIWLDDGSGFDEVASVSSGNSISYDYFPTKSGEINIRITATISGEELEQERSHHITLVQPVVKEELPSGLLPGINYHEDDPTKVTLVLEAPGKTYCHVGGDFSDWVIREEYQMKQTPDGELFWLEIDGLTPQQPYVFLYLVDGEIPIGDPYTELVVDPWNDPWIDESTYPDIPEYGRLDLPPASVLETDQEEYQWAASEDSWERPDLDHIVIYELLVRDFLGSHSYADLIDTLSYIKNLGVDAIELMPFNEFEGNESWGYNPSFYFAPDKYYGPAEDLKRFIEAAHQEGLAVIMDMVLNHAFGQNPMVRLYFDYGTFKPTPDNPWFNVNHVGPFEWGFDFDHESDYTKRFIDRVNTYWIEEYHIDGYRFDFTKGFTNYAPGGSIDGYDQSRVDILDRMANVIWEKDPESYIILEHWGPQDEEQVLANYGMKMWRNRSYDYVPATIGSNGGNFGGMNARSHVSYFNSHDENRLAEHALSEGLSNGGYDIRNPLIMYERMKMAAAFCFLFPGPKMLWQFDELGYDIHIDFNGRVGNKPLPWGPDGLGYYEDPLRQYIYDAYQGILDVRRQIDPVNMQTANTNHRLAGATRRLVYDMSGTDLVVIGNFGLNEEAIDPAFTQTGSWYDYFSGESIEVSNTNAPINLKPGEWYIYTTQRLSDGFPDVVATYDNPVTITPYPFTKSEEITITFDAAKAWPGETDGLIDAEKVYMHSGVILDDPASTELEKVVGTLSDDGVGEMTKVGDQLWEITMTPADYYKLLEDEEPFKLGMYFRDADNSHQGFGFRNGIIYSDVASEQPFVTIDPPSYLITDEITITFNAKRGNRELVGADKVYMHSSVDLTDTETPQSSAWEYTVGNWGQDDGIGEMSPVPGEEDLWQITLTPKEYYNLSDGDQAYWLAAVFRSADGNTKGTGQPGPIENGFIHTNLDFFIRNMPEDLPKPGSQWKATLFPNPTAGNVTLQTEGGTGNIQVEIFDASGRLVAVTQLQGPPAGSFMTELNTGTLSPGVYWVRIKQGEQEEVIKLSRR